MAADSSPDWNSYKQCIEGLSHGQKIVGVRYTDYMKHLKRKITRVSVG